MSQPTPPSEPSEESASRLAALEHDRLLSYVEWAEVEVPWWYWPAYGVALAAFVATYSFGVWWGTVGAVAFAATMGAMLGTMTSRSGVSTPRFRAMPGRLRKTFLPIVVVGLASLGAIAGGLLIAPEPPLPMLGLAIGTCLAAAGWVHTIWYRAEARRLAQEHGLRG